MLSNEENRRIARESPMVYPPPLSIEEEQRFLRELDERMSRPFSDEDHQRALREWQELSEQQRLDAAIPHQIYCTLCGIPFWSCHQKHHGPSDGDEDCFRWVGFFLSLRIPKRASTGSHSGICITGIGHYDQQLARLPPPGYDIRKIWEKGGKRRGIIRSMMNEDEKKEWSSFERIYHSGDEMSHDYDKYVYLMHPSCWNILLQQYALGASPTDKSLDLDALARAFLQIPLGKYKGGFVPDWATDYDGPEPFWWCHTEEASFDENELGRAPQWHFLQRDPEIASGFGKLFADPPLESAANTSARIQFADEGGDIFGRLPEEIITEILILLPSASVRDLQLASRKAASIYLSSTYWRSRFEWPNDLCHVKLPKKFGQVDGKWVDWRRLCDQLLHPVGEEYGWWKNRKRITALNKQLLKSMPLRDSHGRLKKAEEVSTAK